MIRSMTGFGRGSFEVDGVGFEVEIRAVNHRHLDTRVRLPRQLSEYEAAVRGQISGRLGRGKVDCAIAPSSGGGAVTRLEIDAAAAAELLAAAEELRRRHALSGSLEVAGLLSFPGVARFVETSLASDVLSARLAEAVDSALDGLDRMRVAEGEVLAGEFDSRLARVVEFVRELEQRSGLVQQAVREKLRKRSEQLRQETGLLDEARLHQEIVIAADRHDVTEELVRLRSHVEQFRAIVAEGEQGSPVGRRLDFLLQELMREANTVGSKANDAPLAHFVVELKTDIERIREQVQNVE